ncbi:MAG: aldehyde ferredoxin oxidoreductase C-terminal domain-containing protein, partial [Chloroflexota bacterium]|nr:aldehyde ferredoxin oxidoreductase C-terminal domain-containing protein [Chloroflexota bacterium]
GFMKHYVAAVNTVTGWDLSIEEGLRLGERIAALTRAYAWRTGMTPDTETLSPRLLEAPRDGPAQGKSIRPFWNEILDGYYSGLGWDRKSGRPLPETLKRLELDEVIPDLWGEEPSRSKRAGTERS